MRKMEEKRAFYRKIFSGDPQNSIIAYIRTLSIQLAKEALEQTEGDRTLTEEQELAIRYHAHGILGLLREWIFAKESMETGTLAAFLYRKTLDFLKEALTGSNTARMTSCRASCRPCFSQNSKNPGNDPIIVPRVLLSFLIPVGFVGGWRPARTGAPIPWGRCHPSPLPGRWLPRPPPAGSSPAPVRWRHR